MARRFLKYQATHSLSAAGLLALTFLIGCGKPVKDEAKEAEEGTPVVGVAGFGSQCPYGFTEDPFPARLELWNCPIGLEKVELSEPLRPLYFQVDCKKKTMSVRKPNRTMDTAWEIMPDGSFFMTVDGGMAKLNSDGPGRGKCGTPLSVDLMGKVDCSDRDKVNIKVESVFWLAKKNENNNPRNVGVPGMPVGEPNPSMTPSPAVPGEATENETLPECKVPPSCYFFSKTTIKQCG
jgi:hypothetical protein